MSQKNIPTWSRLTVSNRSLRRCERCGGPGSQWHHRRGRSVVDEHRHCPCNGVWLCHTCHLWCHQNPALAKDEGFIVMRNAQQPSTYGFAHYQGRWVKPDCSGGLSTVETEGDTDVER